MFRKFFWWFCVSFLSTSALAEEQCQDLVTYQVCWPENEFFVFSGVQNGSAVFAGAPEGFSLSTDVTGAFGSAVAVKDYYLSLAPIHEGTYDEIDSSVKNGVLTFAVSTVSNAPNVASSEPRTGVPRILSVLSVQDKMILIETFFLNPFQLPKYAVWNDEKLEIHKKFASYIRAAN